MRLKFEDKRQNTVTPVPETFAKVEIYDHAVKLVSPDDHVFVELHVAGDVYFNTDRNESDYRLVKDGSFRHTYRMEEKDL